MRLCAGTRAGCHSGGRPRAWPRYGRPGGERTRLEQPSRSEIGVGMDANGNLASPAPMPMIRHRFAATRGGAFGSLVPCRRHRRAEPVHLGHPGTTPRPRSMEWPGPTRGFGGGVHEVRACGRGRRGRGHRCHRLWRVRRGRQGPQGRHLAPVVGIRARQRRPRRQGRQTGDQGLQARRLHGRPACPGPRGQRRPRPAAGCQGHDGTDRGSRGRRRRRSVQLVRGQGPDPDLQRGRTAPVLAREHQPGPHQG